MLPWPSITPTLQRLREKTEKEQKVQRLSSIPPPPPPPPSSYTKFYKYKPSKLYKSRTFSLPVSLCLAFLLVTIITTT
ncbi:hypothetical protein AQUCO_04200043v1 [Aquilegia coerulea]|uniref:Uncharacterized protein n=1 Tax=Aquilegia coerulea TaxID=218851 RepID=A0A2G5CPB1_AQUCA|nr:hypothetical protein AQUCO_04200043v1 [Aquilegia coerulea]